MADRIKNYQQGADEIAILKDIRTTLGVTPSSYTPDATEVTRDRVVTFAQAEEELSVLGDIQTGMQKFVADTKFQVGENTGDIANIKALLQGQLYNYQTDSTEAYTKTVPAGALPYAGIEQIGGKTLVMNQLVKDGNFALGDTTYWKKQGTTSTTLEFANGVATVTLGGNPSVFNPAITQQTDAYIQAVQGHKYLIKAETMADFTITGLYFSSSATGGSFTIECPETKDSWISLSKIITATTDGRLFGYIGAQGRAGIVQGSKLNFRNIFMVDLTLMFGAGNEPSTVAEFETMFPADYYPHNAGTLLSAGVTDVESRINLFQNVTLNVGSIATADGTDATSNTRVRTGYISVKPNTTYTVNSGTTDPEFLAIYNYTDDAYIGYEIISASEYTFTTGATTTRVRFTFHYIDDSTITSAAIVNPSIIDTVTLSIPAEVQALDGYGWSAEMPGSSSNFEVGNYIDFERKKFVQRVDSVDLGTLTWTRYSSNYHLWYANIPTRKQGRNPWTGYPKDTLNYRINWGSTIDNDKSWTIDAINGSYPLRIYINNSAYDNFSGTDVANDLSGKIAYYELATPIETDVSAYLTDNLVQVDPAGTVTFENQNGDDYRIPVPSDVTYMIDLQAAIDNEEE